MKIKLSPRSLFERIVLHLSLFLGALVFGFPFIWMISTSIKTTREMASSELSILPGTPPTPEASPWIDTSTFQSDSAPDDVPEDIWNSAKDRIKESLSEKIDQILDDKDLPQFLDMQLAKEETFEGVIENLSARLSDKARSGGADDIVEDALRLVTNDVINRSFDACYRRIELAQVRARDAQYRYYDLVEQNEWDLVSEGIEKFEKLSDGNEFVELRRNSNNQIIVEHKLKPAVGEVIENPAAFFIGWRGDRSWSSVQVEVDYNDSRYAIDYPIHLYERSWVELEVRMPNEKYTTEHTGRALVMEKFESLSQNEVQKNPTIRLIITPVSPFRAWYAKFSRNYYEAFREVPVARYLGTSFALALLFILLSLFSCSLVAYSFARLRWPGRDLMFLMLLATMMLPPQVTMIPTFLIFKEAGLYNTLVPLWLIALFGTPFFIFLLRQFFKTIPKDLEEAARLDGCNAYGIWWHVMLPLVKPALAAVGIFAFLMSWNDFLRPLIFLSDERLFPLSLGLFKLSIASGENITLMMAAAFTMTLPIVIVFFFAQRYFIEGVTLTGTKG